MTIHFFLLFGLLPAWLFVGLGDWWCHRKSEIEKTSGVRESVLHLILSGLAAAAILPALLLNINALILVWMIAMFVAHEAVTTLDLHLAAPARPITTTEVRIHDFLTAVPFAGLLLVLATHTDQIAPLFGFGDKPLDLSLDWKSPALPTGYLMAWIGGAFALNIMPFSEELLRCWNQRCIARFTAEM